MIFLNVLTMSKTNFESVTQAQWIENSSDIEFSLSFIYMLTATQSLSADQSNNKGS